MANPMLVPVASALASVVSSEVRVMLPSAVRTAPPVTLTLVLYQLLVGRLVLVIPIPETSVPFYTTDWALPVL